MIGLIAVVLALHFLWKKHYDEAFFGSLNFSVAESTFIFCPELSVSFRFASIRSAAIKRFVVVLLFVAISIISLTQWLSRVLSRALFLLFAVDAYIYYKKKKAYRDFLQGSTEAARDHAEECLRPVMHAHLLLLIYQLYLVVAYNIISSFI